MGICANLWLSVVRGGDVRGGDNLFVKFVGFVVGFYNFVGGIFLRNLIFYDEYETCGFDFCADGGGAAVGGSKWGFYFGEV